jgi:hypothetical protein
MNDYLENESNKVKIIVRIRNPIRRDKYEKEFLDLDETVKKTNCSTVKNINSKNLSFSSTTCKSPCHNRNKSRSKSPNEKTISKNNYNN